MTKKLNLYILIFLALFVSLNHSFGEDSALSNSKDAKTEVSSEPPYFPLDEPIEDSSNSRFYQEFTQMLFTLGLLIAALIGASFFMKKFMTNRVQYANEASKIKVVEQRALTPKLSLHLIEYNGNEYLVAESMQGAPLLIATGKEEVLEPSSEKRFSLDKR